MSKKDFKGGLDAMLGGKQAESEQDSLARRMREQVNLNPQKSSRSEELPEGPPKRDTLIPVAGKKLGRPRTNFREIEKSSQEGCKEAETRATFIVSEADLERIKAMAYWERITIKEIVNAALREYIKRHETKNGPIQPIPEKR